MTPKSDVSASKNAIGGILKIGATVSALATLVGVIWFVAQLSFRVDNLEKSQVTSEQIAKVIKETIKDSFEGQTNALIVKFDERYVKKGGN